MHGSLCALFRAAEQPAAAASEVAWYEARLPRDAGPLLDAMCGTGNLLAPLCAAGFNVHGVDVSAAMLERCEARLAGPGDARLFRQDLADLNLPFRYAAAYVANGALQSITDTARARAALSRIRAHLVSPAKLIVDFFVPGEGEQRIAAPLVEVTTVVLADGTRIALRSETTMLAEAPLARTTSRYVHRRGNELLAEESEAGSYTWYAVDDAVALLNAAGFTGIEIGESPGDARGGTRFSLCARSTAA